MSCRRVDVDAEGLSLAEDTSAFFAEEPSNAFSATAVAGLRRALSATFTASLRRVGRFVALWRMSFDVSAHRASGFRGRRRLFT